MLGLSDLASGSACSVTAATLLVEVDTAYPNMVQTQIGRSPASFPLQPPIPHACHHTTPFWEQGWPAGACWELVYYLIRVAGWVETETAAGGEDGWSRVWETAGLVPLLLFAFVWLCGLQHIGLRAHPD